MRHASPRRSRTSSRANPSASACCCTSACAGSCRSACPNVYHCTRSTTRSWRDALTARRRGVQVVIADTTGCRGRENAPRSRASARARGLVASGLSSGSRGLLSGFLGPHPRLLRLLLRQPHVFALGLLALKFGRFIRNSLRLSPGSLYGLLLCHTGVLALSFLALKLLLLRNLRLSCRFFISSALCLLRFARGRFVRNALCFAYGGLSRFLLGQALLLPLRFLTLELTLLLCPYRRLLRLYLGQTLVLTISLCALALLFCESAINLVKDRLTVVG